MSLVSQLYDSIASSEDARLTTRPMERELTLRTILSHLPSSGLKIADIGGASGVHAFRLAELGHQVHLRDLSPGLIALAEEKQGSVPPNHRLASIAVGNALDPHLFDKSEAGTFDAVLLLGPLYHLTEYDDRKKAIQNALSLLKPNGVLFCAFITLQAHLRDIAIRNPARFLTEFDSFYEGYLTSGKYVRERGNGHQAQSYHIPNAREGIESLVDDAGGEVVEVLSTEGILGGGLDVELSKVEGPVLEKWLDVMIEMGRKPENLGCADHLLAVVRAKH